MKHNYLNSFFYHQVSSVDDNDLVEDVERDGNIFDIFHE